MKRRELIRDPLEALLLGATNREIWESLRDREDGDAEEVAPCRPEEPARRDQHGGGGVRGPHLAAVAGPLGAPVAAGDGAELLPGEASKR